MRTPLIVLLLTLGVAGTSCGSDPSPREGRATEPSSAEQQLTDPPLIGERDTKTTTISGVVAQGAESGCLLVETGRETFQLIGVLPTAAPLGARVVVTGTQAPELLTTCQQGIPFQVRTIRPTDS